MTTARFFALGLLAVGLAGPRFDSFAKPRAAELDPASSPVGEAIYLKGVIGSGALLAAARADAEPVTGDELTTCEVVHGVGHRPVLGPRAPVAGDDLARAGDEDL